MLAEGQDGWHTHGQVVATDVEELCVLDVRPDVGRLEVLELVVVCSGKVSNHGSVEAGDDDTTATSELVLVDAVLGEDALLHAGVGELFTERIFTDTADVDDGLWWKSVLFFRTRLSVVLSLG